MPIKARTPELEHNQAAIREREIELQNWHANVALYTDSTDKMLVSAAQWRDRAHELAPRIERPSQRWAWGLGGLVLGLLAAPVVFGPPKEKR